MPQRVRCAWLELRHETAELKGGARAGLPVYGVSTLAR